MRQAGVMAAAALIGLRDWPRLSEDHAVAASLGAGLRERFPEGVDALQVQTNMVLLDSRQTAFTAKELIAAAGKAGIRLAEGRPGVLRLVTHRDIDQADVDRLLKTIDGLS